MQAWKKLAGALVAVVVIGGAGAAVAETVGGDNPPGPDAATAAGGDRLIGNGITETEFVAMIPCRIVDTREAGPGKLQVGAARTFDVRGSEATFTIQGGNPGGCGIPQGASAIEATVTAVESGSGFLRAWPANITQPNATFLNYTSSFNVSNTGAITICGSNGLSCEANKDLNVRAYGSATHVVIDVQGYYTQPLAAQVNSNGSLARSSRVVSATRDNTGTYRVIFDRRVKECTFNATVSTADGGTTNGYAIATNLGVNVNGVYVDTFDTTGANADRGFSLEVIC